MGFFKGLRDHFVPHADNAYRPHVLKRPYLMLFLGLALLTEGALVASLLARESGFELGAAVVRSDIVALTNTERARAQAGMLVEDPLLTAAAQSKAADMAARAYFSHIGPDGKEPWAWILQAGYDYQYAGENLAVRFVDSSDVMVAWMRSPTHKANIIKGAYTEVGVGVAQGTYKGQPATYVVQYFGKPSSAMLAARATKGTVLGASVATPQPSLLDSLSRQAVRMLAEPRGAAAWMLGGISTILMLALVFVFFHHSQIRAHDLLAPGAVVAGIALTLLVLNNRYLVPSDAAQTASAGSAGWSVEIGDGAATAER